MIDKKGNLFPSSMCLVRQSHRLADCGYSSSFKSYISHESVKGLQPLLNLYSWQFNLPNISFFASSGGLKHFFPVSNCGHFPGAEAPMFLASVRLIFREAEQPLGMRERCQHIHWVLKCCTLPCVGKTRLHKAEGAALADFGVVTKHKGLDADLITSRHMK